MGSNPTAGTNAEGTIKKAARGRGCLPRVTDPSPLTLMLPSSTTRSFGRSSTALVSNSATPRLSRERAVQVSAISSTVPSERVQRASDC